MNLLLSLYLVAHTTSSLAVPYEGLVLQRASFSIWQGTPIAMQRDDPFGSIPRQLVMLRSRAGTLALAPTGAEGPPPAAVDALSATSHDDRLKADRMAGLKAVGAGVVLTLTEF